MTAPKLLVLDIDNTVFDWVAYYSRACSALLRAVGTIVKAPYQQIAAEARDVFTAHGSIEYPFVVQELPAVVEHYGSDIDAMLKDCVAPAREAFKDMALKYLVPYDGVEATLDDLKSRFPKVPRVALTDAPRYVAMWKLNKLGLLTDIDAVYGLPDPRLPTDTAMGRVKVDPEILLKHLQQSNFGFSGRIRILPDDYEKPGTKGLKTVLMDFDMDESPEARRSVLWVGDNLRKDIGLGNRLGVRTAWAEYGTKLDQKLLKELKEFSPESSIHKNVMLTVDSPDAPKPDRTLVRFADLISEFP